MTIFILSLIAFIIFLFIGAYYFGRSSAYNKVLKKNLSREVVKDNKEECSLGIMLGLYVGFVALMIWAGGGFGELRDNYIDKWRNNEIIEQVNYEYHRINGEQVVVDSTFNYIKNPDFKK